MDFEQLKQIQRQDEFVKRVEAARIGKRYKDCTFANLDARGIPDIVAKQYAEVKTYAANLDEHIKSGTGLILRGPVGTMKTTMAVAVLMQHLHSGGRGLFITMASLLDTIFSLKHKNAEEWAKFENDIRTAKIILIDDLGAEYTEGWVKTKVDSIISERYNACLPTLITTNLSGKDLQNTYAERVLDRIRSTAVDVVFNGKSLRAKAV